MYLVAEGEYNRVMKAMEREEKKVQRITRGSDIPVYKISVGHGPKQVPLDKLQKTILKKKVKLTKYELEELNSRLTTLASKNTMGIPKGVDPTRMSHMSRRAMRGKGSTIPRLIHRCSPKAGPRARPSSIRLYIRWHRSSYRNTIRHV